MNVSRSFTDVPTAKKPVLLMLHYGASPGVGGAVLASPVVVASMLNLWDEC